MRAALGHRARKWEPVSGEGDPFGHRWILSTHVEDVSEDEMQRRMAEAFNEPA